jgi:hypothetical protein
LKKKQESIPVIPATIPAGFSNSGKSGIFRIQDSCHRIPDSGKSGQEFL